MINQNLERNLDNCSDEHLVCCVQQGDTDALELLFSRFQYRIRYICKGYFLRGSDYDDLYQEGLIGFYKSLMDSSTDKGVSFNSFANMCIRRQIISALKASLRQKHIPLNSSTSLFRPIQDDDRRVLADMIENPEDCNPERLYLVKEQLFEVVQELHLRLSILEFNALTLYLEGYSYAQIGKKLGISDKSVTNTMYRLQKKLKLLRTEVLK